jgi:aspartate-semialdehyde dehydrogenase
VKKLPARPKVAVVGATGAVGRVMLSILTERNFPASEVRAIATERSRGRAIPFGDGSLIVETEAEGGLGEADLVLVDTPDEVALDVVPRAAESGAVVIDNSAAWRMEQGVPLVVPEVNAGVLDDYEGRIVASPNCTTIALVVPLSALDREFGVQRVVASSYQAVSGAGQSGVEELREQTAKVADEIDALGEGAVEGLYPDLQVFPAPIAFNVIPRVGSEKEQGYTGEEWKLVYETRKIMGHPDLPVSSTLVRVPAVVGHGIAVHAQFGRELSPEAAMEVLEGAEGVEVVDLPTPLLSAGKDVCFVGRIRQDPFDPTSILFFSACDNLRKGAALNAIQIAELLLKR